ncbi:hypothetical protein H6F86_16820 [Phormidium sp. FACHB-592]|uniref:Uncharacterized protein n=1 Tax=Stenomitos frigidus AS-A4 TaxID=2933935 RepID=A0ABV0KU52_9CYAN|nr:hypothetical protein [Phormidium sp. FACHB-592]MBD2075529.1 hypothetical protein [Phormidium sp. FACHB-592]
MSISLFDANFYRAANADLATFSNEQAAAHFQTYGLGEGRRFSAFADLSFYRASNPDLAAAGVSSNQQLFGHLQTYGVGENRQFSQFVDLNFYLTQNADVSQAYGGNRFQALQHLEVYGLNEGRSFSKFVDLNFYQANNPDLLAADAGPKQLLQHLEIYGLEEGRRFSKLIDVNYYLANNPDLQAAGLSKAQAYNHFMLYGQYEYRITVATALYNRSLGGLPDSQGWLDYTTLRSTSALPTTGNGSETFTSGGTRFVSDAVSYTGYSNYTANLSNPFNPSLNLVNSAFPTLDRNDGFRINFDVQINSESHNNDNRAGFSIVVISDDLQGIEIGFWTNQIWAQQVSGNVSTRSTAPTANANLDTTVFNNYNLVVQGNAYQLYTNDLKTLLLSGFLTDYSSFNPQVPVLPFPVNPPNPYQTPNLLFFGDDTTSAGADVTLGNVTVVPVG